MKILVVDDNISDLFLTTETLKDLDSDISILTAEDGESAISIIESEYNTIDLILLDIKMPKISGIELLKKIKKDYPFIKIIMLTTSYLERDIYESELNNADGFIIKPLDQEEFENKMRTLENVFINEHFQFLYKKKNK